MLRKFTQKKKLINDTKYDITYSLIFKMEEKKWEIIEN